MITKFNIHDEKEMMEWDSFVKFHEDGTPFHLSCWLRTIEETYSFEPLLYAFKGNKNNLVGIFPIFRQKSFIMGTRFVSLPFSDYCVPLCVNEESQIKLLKHIINEAGNKTKYIEIKGHIYTNSDFVRQDYYKRHVLRLYSNPEEVRKNIDKRTIQYNIRKAQKTGVVITEANSKKGIEEFYRLNLLTRRRHGVPPQPKKFFFNLFNNMISKDYAFILLAIWNSQTIAAGLFFKFKNAIYYKYNVSNPFYLSKKSPNHILTWTAIERACLDGYRYFDFGRTSPDNLGLMRYKAMWGAETNDLPYFYYPRLKGMGSKGESGLVYRFITRLWRILPNSVISKIGPLIYKHLG